jgi:hypothetical protein
MKVIELAGSHFDMGRQHAQQVGDLRVQILEAVRQRLGRLERYGLDLQPFAVELASVWEETARPTLEMLRGIAEGLELDWDSFFRYTIAPYLENSAQRQAPGEGCTVWAASRSVTREGLPILAKNRDYRPEHQSLSCLARVQPAQGYRYLCATSAGSPAVFSSGMNEVGLAVADTHVASRCISSGVARYSAMMEILEHHDHVSSAVDYLRQVRQLGDGTLTLIDQSGDMAVVEANHATRSAMLPENDFVVSTNHYRSPQMRDCWVDRYPPELRGNSHNRHARVVTALGAARGRVDAAWARSLMADHGGALLTDAHRSRHAICRHSEVDTRSITISTALFLPRERTLLFANGQPCRTPFQAWSVV